MDSLELLGFSHAAVAGGRLARSVLYSQASNTSSGQGSPGPPHMPPGTSNYLSTKAGDLGHRLLLFGQVSRRPSLGTLRAAVRAREM